MDNETNKRLPEISHPEVWTLALHLSGSELKYAASSRVEDGSLTFGAVKLNGNEGKFVAEVESAVYDNPFFLSQFGQTSILVDSDKFLVIPDEMTAGCPEECRRYFNYIFHADHELMAVDRIEEAGVSIAYSIDRELDSFLRRTFYNPPILHSLTPLLRFLAKKEKFGTNGKTYAFLDKDCLRIIAFKSNRLVYANSFRFSNNDDAFYYVMNAWNVCEMTNDSDELYLSGDKALKTYLLPNIREHIKFAAQMIFPADMLRLGKDVMTAPFDLLTLQQ